MSIGEHATEVASVLSLASIAWSAAYAWTRWLIRPRETVLGAPEYQEFLAARITRLEEAVGAMNTQLAQLAEGQRATARMLSERLRTAERALGAESGRVITPH